MKELKLNSKAPIYLSFDVEDWFHLLDNPSTKYPYQWHRYEKRVHIGLDLILDLCSRKKIKATFFCLGWIAEEYPDLIIKIHNQGHYIGTHGYAHRLVYELSQEEFRYDLIKSISILENIVGYKIEAYRAPGFSITEDSLWAIKILSEVGIKYDSSVFPGLRSHGGIPNINVYKPFCLRVGDSEIIEFPLPVIGINKFSINYTGGGYFRLIPYWILKLVFERSDYLMTYFHPRDFDSEQPYLKGLSLIRFFKSYYGIRSCLHKLELLLERHDCSLMTDYPKECLEILEL